MRFRLVAHFQPLWSSRDLLNAIDTEASRQFLEFRNNERRSGEIIVSIVLSYSIPSDYDFGVAPAPFLGFLRLIVLFLAPSWGIERSS